MAEQQMQQQQQLQQQEQQKTQQANSQGNELMTGVNQLESLLTRSELSKGERASIEKALKLIKGR
jgi:FKBP-type peptidyl-prolyl cis-trans isomerase